MKHLPFDGMEIRSRLLILFLALCLLLFAGARFAADNARNKVIEAEKQNLLVVAKQLAQQQSLVLERVNNLLSLLAIEPRLRQPARSDCVEYLRMFSARLPEQYDEIQVLQPDGSLACSSLPIAQELNAGDRAGFGAALAVERSVAGDAMVSRSTGARVLPVYRALRDDAGTVKSVISISIETSRFVRAIVDARLPAGTNVGLVDSKGMVVVRHPDPDGWTGRDASRMPLFTVLSAQREPGVAETAGLDGAARIIAFVPLARPLEGQLTLFVSEPVDAITGAAQAWYRTLALGAALVLAALFLLLWAGSERILLRPLSRLAHFGRQLSQGDASARRGFGQAARALGKFGRPLDSMAETLSSGVDAARSNRALQALVAGKRIQVDNAGEQAIFDSICRSIVDSGGYRAAWVGLPTSAADGMVAPAAAAGVTIEYLQQVAAIWKSAGPENSAVGRALRDNSPCVIADIQAEPGQEHWRDIAHQHQVAAVVALPLHRDGMVSGVLVIYAAEAGSFATNEVGLLADLATDIDKALLARRERLRRREAEDARDASHRQLVESQRIAHVGSWEGHRSSGRLEGSDEFYRIYEFRPEQGGMKFQAMFDAIHPDDRERVSASFAASITAREPCTSTHRLLFPDGRIKIVQQYCETQCADDGTPLASSGTVQDVTDLVSAQSALRERAREIRCLYDVFRATEQDDKSVEEVCAAVAAILPPAWQHADVAAAQVRFDGSEFSTAGFRETPWMQVAPFDAGGRSGDITVAYLAPRPVAAEGPFLLEERQLIDAVAKRTGESISRRVLAARASDREAIFSAIVNQARDAVALVDPETGQLIEFNETACRDLGYSREEFARMRVQDINPYYQDTEMRSNMALMLRPDGATIEARFQTRSGEMRDVRVSARPVAVRGKRYLAAIWADVTESNHAAAQLRRANRELHAIADAMRVIVFARDEMALLHQLCQSVIGSGGYRMAWVGYAEDDERRSIRPVAHAGTGEDYAKSIDITWSEQPTGLGPTGTCVRECRTVVARFIHTDPTFGPWREAAIRHGYASSISMPLLANGGHAGGALMIYAAAPDAFDTDEASHLSALADALSYGIQALRDRAAGVEAEAAVQRTALRLAHLLKSSPVVVYSLQQTESGELVPGDVSENVSRILGYSQQEALAPGWWASNLHPEDRKRAFAASEECLRSGNCTHDYRFAHRDGRYLWIQDELHMHRDAAGKIVEVIGAWTDVTAAKTAEAEIRKLSAVAEQTPNSVIITDLDANIEYVNEAFVRNTGYSRGEVIGRHPRFLQSGKVPAATYEQLWRELNAGRPWRGEFINRHKDGSVRVKNSVIAPLRQPDGRISHYVAVEEDVTERRQIEDQLRKLYLAVEQSPESIVISDLDARIEYVNEAFVRHSGYSREEVIGQNPRLLQSGKTPRETHLAMWAALTRGQPWKGEFVNRRKDGSEYVELVTMTPVHEPDGRITHYLAIKDDITEKQKMTRELEEHRHHLEALVGSRTAELAEARKRAEEASLAKSAFVANMSHEIRTPMNAIIGLTYLLMQSGMTDEQMARLRRLDVSSRHLLTLIDDILDLSKIEAGKMVIDQLPFDLRKVTTEAFEITAGRARDKGIDAQLLLDPGLPALVEGDAMRLRQVLLNFGSNAVKFTQAGSISLRVSASDGDRLQPRIRFEVADTGIGIDAAQLGRLFLPFEQADSSITRRFGGTGLGLAISRRLVELMGGQIGVESQPDAGSTFWFTLPLKTLSGAAPVGEAMAPPPGRFEAVAASGLRILLVDDEPVNQEVASELLHAAGHQVELAANGMEAVDRARHHTFDLVLMDMQMPVMDGLAATQALRKIAAFAETPIIAMTANAFSADRDRCIAAGMNDFIPKPVDPARLYQTIARWAPVTRAPAADDAAGAAVPTGELPPSFADRLSGVADLDINAGLQAVQGFWDTYQRLLAMYVAHHAGDIALLRRHLETGKVTNARRVAHTLKGVAATLGASAVQRAAAALELLLREQGSIPATAELEPLIQSLDQANGSLVTALSVALDAEQEAVPAQPDWNMARDLIAQADALLAEDDVRAVAIFRDHRALLRAALGEPAAEISRCVADFDFVRALALLRAVMSSVPGPPQK